MKMSTRHFATIGSRAEEPLDEFITADSKMRSHIAQNSGQRPYFERVVIRNCNVMPATFLGSQAQVAACLPRRSITHAAQCLGKIRSRNVSGQFHLPKEAVSTGSTGQHLLANEMQANNLRRFSCVKMAIHSVADLLAERLQSFRFGENRLAQGACCETAFHRFFDEKNDFVHALRAKREFTLPKFP
jgi:DNA-binding transcriptional regulator LsrR (DeoR family)